MHRHRLERLARLTTGAALLGASALAGCNNEPKAINSPDPQPHPNATAQPDPIHVNAPPDPQPSASTASNPSATPSASAQQPPRPITHTMNAPAHVNAIPVPSK